MLTIVLRLVLVMQLGMGVTGLYLADVLVTVAIMAALVRWFAPLIRPVFSTAVLRDALAFGLPRVPHAAAQQVIAVGDKFILTFLRARIDDYRRLRDGGVVRADAEAVPERLRIGLGAVLLRDDSRAGRAAGVPHGHDLRHRGARAADGGTVGRRAPRRARR